MSSSTSVQEVASTGERLATDWYGDLVGARRLALRTHSTWDAVRSAWTVFRASASCRSVVTTEGSMSPVGLGLLALLLALRRRRRLVLLQFLPGRKVGLSGRLVVGLYRLVLRRACLGVQVMTAGEKDAYQRTYLLPPDRVRHVPYYSVDDRVPLDVVGPDLRTGILASGRNSCDWTTLLDAAEGQGWPLTIVCSESDLAGIARRAAATGVEVLAELPRAEHNQMLATAQLFLVVMKDRGASSGHVRLASAALRGTPVLATSIPGMSGYEHLALATVPAEDPIALRDEVNRLLAEPGVLAEAAERVRREAWQRPLSRYAREIRAFVDECEGSSVPAPGPATGTGSRGA